MECPHEEDLVDEVVHLAGGVLAGGTTQALFEGGYLSGGLAVAHRIFTS
jgi:hypothetical protein